MGRYADWMLVEIERLLKDRLPAPKLAELLAEIQGHVEDSASDLRSQGTRDDAEREAVRRFGTPWRFAYGMLGEGFTESYWRAAWRPAALCFVTAMLGPAAVFYRWNPIPHFVLGVLLFCAASFLSKRSLPVPLALAAGGAAVCALIVGTFALAPSSPWDVVTLRSEVSQRMAVAEQAGASNEAALRAALRGGVKPPSPVELFRPGRAQFEPQGAAEVAARDVVAWNDELDRMRAAAASTRWDAAAAAGKVVLPLGAAYLATMVGLGTAFAALGRFVATARLLPRRLV